MVNSAVNKSPLSAFNTPGALTLVTLNTMDDAASKPKAATIKSSMPCRLPWLSNIGTVNKILKLASGDMVA